MRAHFSKKKGQQHEAATQSIRSCLDDQLCVRHAFGHGSSRLPIHGVASWTPRAIGWAPRVCSLRSGWHTPVAHHQPVRLAALRRVVGQQALQLLAKRRAERRAAAVVGDQHRQPIQYLRLG